MTRFHHVANGTSATSTILDAGIPGTWSIWADPLSEGPVPGGLSDAELMDVRRRFLGGGTVDDDVDPVIDLRNWRSAIEHRECYDELVLWFEHDLFDQLALIRLLSRLARRGLPQQLTIVSIDRHPEVPNFLGFGQLKPEQLAELWPRRTTLSRDAIDESVAAWIAVTAADPRALAFLIKRIKAMPFLAGAIERQLEELPDPTSGLSRTERQVLAAIARGEATAGAILQATHAIDPRYPLTDTLLFSTLQTLGRCGFIQGAPEGAPSPAALKAAQVQVTPHGREALAGAVDRIHAHGIDDWRGGVRLAGKGPVWRWDGAQRKLVER